MRRVAVAIVASLALSACYHVTVETSPAPAPGVTQQSAPQPGKVIENQWAASFIGGLVPPSTLETAAKCPNGVYSVETQLSFLNMLVGGVTMGIYTPMDIKVTCVATK